jgi:hypothetical protein
MQFDNENITRFFILSCIDTTPPPKGIEYTPTMLIKGVPTPYVGSDVFKWLAKIKEWKRIVIAKKRETKQNKYLNQISNNLRTEDNNNIMGFNKMEMDSLSDIFSFFSSNMDNECQEAMPQKYVNCNDNKNSIIFAPPIDSESKIDSVNQKSFVTNLHRKRHEQEMEIKNSFNNYNNRNKPGKN